MNTQELEQVAKLLRGYVLRSTTAAGSGHPSSCLSSVELMSVLFFDGVLQENDHLIFSKGHAAPLLYSLFTASGNISEEELLTLRKFDSNLEGHPTKRFPFAEAATGSLGQGLSIGFGMALGNKYLDKTNDKTFVLLGDSEMAEGSNWEAMMLASHYKLNNLVGILDVNRLGQRGETMQGDDVLDFQRKAQSFGWQALVIYGHDFNQIKAAYSEALKSEKEPTLIIAKTIKGKGVSILEDKEGWHGKALNQEQLEEALEELGPVKKANYSTKYKPNTLSFLRRQESSPINNLDPRIREDDKMKASTRKAYGEALVKLGELDPNLVVLDAEVSNSTFSATFKEKHPERFFEMFIAEQNMLGAAVGLSNTGKRVFVSSFAAFLTRAFDQIRQAQYGKANFTICGSHAGVSIGEDGPSQMGLEDIAMMRSILDSTIVYPADSVATHKLVFELANREGINYIRTTRAETPTLYDENEEFSIGGSKTLKSSKDELTIISAGITLFEALKAYDELKDNGINIRVIDLYSIKPIDTKTLQKAANETKALIVVEDHYKSGGITDAVREALSEEKVAIYSLAVNKTPRSGKPEELLAYEDIDKNAIVNYVRRQI